MKSSEMVIWGARTCKLSLISVIMVKLIHKPKEGKPKNWGSLPVDLKQRIFLWLWREVELTWTTKQEISAPVLKLF